MTDYVARVIKPKIYEKSVKLVYEHLKKGHTVLVISASPDFLVRPIISLLNIKQYIAIKIKQDESTIINSIEGIPPYREGKVKCLTDWIENNKEHDLKGSYFYSDSHNDLPLLKEVDNPVATNPNTQLLDYAEKNNWPIIWTN